MTAQPPFSPAAERNRRPILAVLRRHLAPGQRVLEIGAGTGQHARFFAAELPGIEWQASDVEANLPGLAAGLTAADAPAMPPPLVLDVLRERWPAGSYDAVYSANTAHIMSWAAVRAMLEGAARMLEPGGLLLIYGPFSRGGEQTSESNRRFDRQLRSRDAAMGIRDLEDMDREAAGHGLEREAEYAMPANNLLVVWRGTGAD
jgi:cyclopropane fatty-acyl-phospholipid synthase-like methyltransferase